MTSKAPIAASEPVEATATDRSTRQLLQVPLFLLSLALLLGGWMTYRCRGRCLNWEVGKEVNSARHLLQKPDGSLEHTVELLERALKQSEQIPNRLGEVHLLLGTAQLRQADRAVPPLALGLYQSARQHLQEAESQGVPERDRGPLRYRLAKVAFHTGDDPDQVVKMLAGSIDQAEEREKADAYAVLTEAYLRLQPPDYRAALAANEKLRKDIAGVPEEMQGPARLKGGELLLRDKRPEEARKVLLRLVSTAPRTPKAILARAKLLLAQSYQDESRWEEALPHWRTALIDVPETSGDRGVIYYKMGLCHHKLGQIKEAQTDWADCCRTAQGQEGQAAALALADLYLQGGEFDSANLMLSQAVGQVDRPGAWNNSLVDLTRVREVFERACQAYRQAARFELARDAVSQYERVAEPARPPLIRAEILTDWGRARRGQAQLLMDPESQQKMEELARALFCQAGAAYDTAATTAANPTEQANLLWLAIGCYRDAPDNGQVLVLMDRFLKINTLPSRTGEAWWLLGEAQRQEKQLAEAEKAYQQCIAVNMTPCAFKARYQLAVFALQQGNADRAEEILEENLKLIRSDPNADADAREKTMFALGRLCFQKRKYSDVVRQLEQPLLAFPASPEAPLAHFQLAQAYRQLSIQMNQDYQLSKSKDPNTREHYWKENRRYLQKAADEFYELAQFLDDKPDAAPSLNAEERIDVPFQAADCRFCLGKYDEALKLYEVLVERHQGHLEALKALAGTVRCLSAMQRQDEVSKRLADIRAALGNLDGPQKEAWEAWLRVAEKPPALPQRPIQGPQ